MYFKKIFNLNALGENELHKNVMLFQLFPVLLADVLTLTVYDLMTDSFFAACVLQKGRMMFCGCVLVWRFYGLLYYN